MKEGKSVLSMGRWQFRKRRFSKHSWNETRQAGSTAEIARKKIDKIEQNAEQK